jgi:hypothetical protein
MSEFDHILNWKLKSGSHTFPGRDGGTCINEAAVVAAGHKYRPIRTVNDMPPSFSRPICALAMSLNDMATDEQRQRLLPFVTRLACADSPAVERARAEYIKQRQCGLLGETFERGLEILERALAIGRQADAIETNVVRLNLEVARPVPSAKKPLRSMLKALLEAAGA